MEDSQHAADDGKTQGDEQVKRPEDKRVNEDDLEGTPHGPVTPSPELSRNQRIDPFDFQGPDKLSFMTNKKNLQALLREKRNKHLY